MGKTDSRNVKYVGFQIDQTADGIIVSQDDYNVHIPVISQRQLDEELTDEEKAVWNEKAKTPPASDEEEE